MKDYENIKKYRHMLLGHYMEILEIENNLFADIQKNTLLKDLDISLRLESILEKELGDLFHLITLKDLSELFTIQQFIKMRNFGKKSLAELEKLFNSANLKFKK